MPPEPPAAGTVRRRAGVRRDRAVAVVNSALINMLMAGRLLYGMANERIIPSVFGTVHEGRRTPWVAIVFTSVIAVILVASADITVLGGSTLPLLLAVFTIVNIAVLVLRRRPVEHEHFRAPSWTPWVGVAGCGFLVTPLSGKSPTEYLVAGILLAVGVVSWLVDHYLLGARRVRVDPEGLGRI